MLYRTSAITLRSLWNGACDRIRAAVSSLPYLKVVRQCSTCLALSRQISLRPRTKERTQSLSSTPDRRPRTRTSISSTQETSSTRLPNANPGQSVFSRSHSDGGKRTAAARARLEIRQGELPPPPFDLIGGFLARGPSLTFLSTNGASPKLANSQWRETMV